jgi:transcriptional regulator with XRE-family HTH domain
VELGDIDMPPDYGETLRQLRKAAGKTLGDIAEALGVSLSYLSDVELGNRAPFDKERTIRLAALLEVDTDELLIPAAESRGAFELEAKAVSPQAREVGAMLMRGWEDFTEDDLKKIGSIARRRVGKKAVRK